MTDTVANDICPCCGRVVARPQQDVPIGVELCLPSNCPAWRTEAVWDRSKRVWLPVDDDGYALDGSEAAL